MPKELPADNLSQIEETQAALRFSIEQAKELTDESERLVQKHRDDVAKTEQPDTAA